MTFTKAVGISLGIKQHGHFAISQPHLIITKTFQTMWFNGQPAKLAYVYSSESWLWVNSLLWYFCMKQQKCSGEQKSPSDKRKVLNIKRMKSDIFNQSQVLPWQAFCSTQPKLLENFMPQKHSSKACFPNLRRARPFTHHHLFRIVSIVYF